MKKIKIINALFLILFLIIIIEIILYLIFSNNSYKIFPFSKPSELVKQNNEDISGDRIFNSRWRILLEDKLTTYVYKGTIEKIEFDKKYNRYYYPLIIYFNKEKGLIMSFVLEEWDQVKIYKENNDNLIKINYKDLKEGDKVIVKISTGMIEKNKDISIIRVKE